MLVLGCSSRSKLLVAIAPSYERLHSEKARSSKLVLFTHMLGVTRMRWQTACYHVHFLWRIRKDEWFGSLLKCLFGLNASWREDERKIDSNPSVFFVSFIEWGMRFLAHMSKTLEVEKLGAVFIMAFGNVLDKQLEEDCVSTVLPFLLKEMKPQMRFEWSVGELEKC